MNDFDALRRCSITHTHARRRGGLAVGPRGVQLSLALLLTLLSFLGRHTWMVDERLPSLALRTEPEAGDREDNEHSADAKEDPSPDHGIRGRQRKPIARQRKEGDCEHAGRDSCVPAHFGAPYSGVALCVLCIRIRHRGLDIAARRTVSSRSRAAGKRRREDRATSSAARFPLLGAHSLQSRIAVTLAGEIEPRKNARRRSLIFATKIQILFPYFLAIQLTCG